MPRKALIGVFLLGSVLAAGCQAPEADEPEPLPDDRAKASYWIGHQMGKKIIGQYADLANQRAMAAGFAEGLAGTASRVADAETVTLLAALNQELAARKTSEIEAQRAAGEAFLAENGKREGVVTLPSGLQYEIIVEGQGATPGATDRVTTHYHGTLVDGTVFDSSVERGEPAQFRVNGVIRGWTEALQLMQVGAKWRLFIPSDLAYGERGAGGSIGPGAALIFEVELLGVN